MNCINCGKTFNSTSASKICYLCQIIYHAELNFGNPTKKFFEIQNKLIASNKLPPPAYARIGQICRDYPEMIRVVYECVCEKDEKINHYFDYTRPFEVIRLCNSCHRKEHLRLNKIKSE